MVVGMSGVHVASFGDDELDSNLLNNLSWDFDSFSVKEDEFSAAPAMNGGRPPSLRHHQQQQQQHLPNQDNLPYYLPFSPPQSSSPSPSHHNYGWIEPHRTLSPLSRTSSPNTPSFYPPSNPPHPYNQHYVNQHHNMEPRYPSSSQRSQHPGHFQQNLHHTYPSSNQHAYHYRHSHPPPSGNSLMKSASEAAAAPPVLNGKHSPNMNGIMNGNPNVNKNINVNANANVSPDNLHVNATVNPNVNMNANTTTTVNPNVNANVNPINSPSITPSPSLNQKEFSNPNRIGAITKEGSTDLKGNANPPSQATSPPAGSNRPSFRNTVPPNGYVCKLCKIPGHWIQSCPDAPLYPIPRDPNRKITIPPDGYVCRLCSIPGHWIQNCPDAPKYPLPFHKTYPPRNAQTSPSWVSENFSDLDLSEGENQIQNTSPNTSPTPSPTPSQNQSTNGSFESPIVPLEDSSTLWMGDLEPWMNDDNLSQYFSQFGEVARVRLATYKYGVPAGYCYITFSTPKMTQTILQMLNGRLMRGTDHVFRLKLANKNGRSFSKPGYLANKSDESPPAGPIPNRIGFSNGSATSSPNLNNAPLNGPASPISGVFPSDEVPFLPRSIEKQLASSEPHHSSPVISSSSPSSPPLASSSSSPPPPLPPLGLAPMQSAITSPPMPSSVLPPLTNIVVGSNNPSGSTSNSLHGSPNLALPSVIPSNNPTVTPSVAPLIFPPIGDSYYQSDDDFLPLEEAMPYEYDGLYDYDPAGRYGPRDPSYSVFVGNLGTEIDRDYLLSVFQKRYESVIGGKVVADPFTGISKGYGFVIFGDEAEQTRAMKEMQGQLCGDRPMRINKAVRRI